MNLYDIELLLKILKKGNFLYTVIRITQSTLRVTQRYSNFETSE